MADQGNARVQVTSVDGNLTHPFRWSQTVGEVRRFAYERLVQDKAQIPMNSTWVEFSGNRQNDETQLSSLAEPRKQPGNEPDLILNLAWTQQGGW